MRTELGTKLQVEEVSDKERVGQLLLRKVLVPQEAGKTLMQMKSSSRFCVPEQRKRTHLSLINIALLELCTVKCEILLPKSRDLPPHNSRGSVPSCLLRKYCIDCSFRLPPARYSKTCYVLSKAEP